MKQTIDELLDAIPIIEEECQPAGWPEITLEEVLALRDDPGLLPAWRKLEC